VKAGEESGRPAPSLSDRPADGLVPLASVSGAGVPLLAGYTLAIATDRRRHSIAAQFEQQGARTISVQATRTVAQPHPPALARATLASVAVPADEVLISSAFGVRVWVAAARSLGVSDRLLETMHRARLLASDARAADGLRELGFSQIWSTPSGTVEDLFGYLQAQSIEGRRVLAQLDGEPVRELTRALMTMGAHVVEVPTFRSERPRHLDGMRRLTEYLVRRQVDALVLLSPSSSEALIAQATMDGNVDDVLNAVVSDVLCFSLGPLAARPLIDRGLTPLLPTRPLVSELIALVERELPARAVDIIVGGHEVQLRGQAIVIGQSLIPIQAGPIAVLRVLAGQPGRVMSAAEIRHQVDGWSDVDDHAIEMAVSRLRRCLDGTSLEGLGLIQTVFKRGYRLAV
jgi:uroporphyrinogen-III synthase